MTPQLQRRPGSHLEAIVWAILFAVLIPALVGLYTRYILGPDRLSRGVAVVLIVLGVAACLSIALYSLNLMFDIRGNTSRALARRFFARDVKRHYSRLVRGWVRFIQHGTDPHIW